MPSGGCSWRGPTCEVACAPQGPRCGGRPRGAAQRADGWLTGFTAAAMAFLAVFALALSLASGRLADRWSDSLTRSATVRIAPPPDQADAQVAIVEEILATTPGVAGARALSGEKRRASSWSRGSGRTCPWMRCPCRGWSRLPRRARGSMPTGCGCGCRPRRRERCWMTTRAGAGRWRWRRGGCGCWARCRWC